MIGPIFIPHNSNTAAAPKIKIKIFTALIIQSIRSFESKSPIDLIKTDSGPIA